VLPDEAPKRPPPAAGAGVLGAAGLAPNENPPAGAAGAAGGAPAPAPSTGLAPNSPPADGVLVPASAGFAPNKPAPAGVVVVGVDVPLPPNSPDPAGLAPAPNSPPPAPPGGGATGVVVCPNPPKAGFEAGVVDPAAGVEALAVLLEAPKPPNRLPLVGAEGADGAVVVGAVEGALEVPPNEKVDAAGEWVMEEAVLVAPKRDEGAAGAVDVATPPGVLAPPKRPPAGFTPLPNMPPPPAGGCAACPPAFAEGAPKSGGVDEPPAACPNSGVEEVFPARESISRLQPACR
jgi:hypothetical protein